MNAILVFDPTNDLLFVKSNKLFRQKVFKYSRLNGLLTEHSSCSTTTTTSAASTTTPTTSSSGNSSDEGKRVKPTSEANASDPKLNFKQFARLQRHRKRRTRTSLSSAINGANTKRPPANLSWEDTSKNYVDVLMLLLTPYVASLRLSNNLSYLEKLERADEHQFDQQRQQRPPQQRPQGEKNSTATSDDDDLLNKFMSSINLNHECKLLNFECNNQSLPESYLSNSATTTTDYGGDFAPGKFATTQMPIDCLKDCQIVYCELYDFIFIHMQELSSNSSFKMRLLQKRIDLFARLALILFGPALNSLRYYRISSEDEPSATSSSVSNSKVNQSKILRHAYEIWLEHQFEPNFLLEANERLILSHQIGLACENVLRKISIRLRSLVSSQRYSHETHMHALLYSGTKLVSQFSCQNSQALNQDDLILILLLVKTYNIHHDNDILESHTDYDITKTTTSANKDDSVSGSGGDGGGQTRDHQKATSLTSLISKAISNTYRQNNRDHPNQFNPANRFSSQNRCSSSAANKIPDYCYASYYNANRRTYEINSSNSSAATTGTTGSFSSSSQSKMRQTSRATCCGSSSSSLSNKLPNQFPIFLSTPGKISERLRVPHMLRFVLLAKGITLVLISEIPTSYLSLQMNRILKLIEHFTRISPQIKLSQLAKINDCVAAIKGYFHGPNIEAASASQGSGDENDDYLAATSTSYMADDLEDCGHESKKQPADSSISSVFSSLIGKYTLGKPPSSPHHQTTKLNQVIFPNDTSKFNQTNRLNVYKSLNGRLRRQCCQLVMRLDDLVRSNLHTYMRQTFNLPVVEHRREALLTSVSLTLRDSIDAFVVQPQLTKLNEPWSESQRQLTDVLDQVKLMARYGLSDYLDYLAVKASCNVTLGAPLTHDMLAIRSFIYVDRSRQGLVVSPMKREARLDGSSLVEGDLFAPISAELSKRNNAEGDNRSEISNSEADEGEQSDDRADATATSGTDESENEKDTKFDELSNIRRKSRSWRHVNPRAEYTCRLQAGPSNQHRASMGGIDRQQVAGSSSSLIMTNSSAATSGDHLHYASSNLSMTMSPKVAGAPNNNSEEIIPDEEVNSLAREQLVAAQQNNLVDESLMKGFTCFVYNRLAHGKTSYTSNDGTYVYSYFLWFKRNSDQSLVRPSEDRRREVAHKLLANYNSLPSVICDDFFNNLSRSLIGDGANGQEKVVRRRRVEISCRISEHSGVKGSQKIVRRKLTRVREEEDEDGTGSIDRNFFRTTKSSDNFGIFLRDEASSGNKTSQRSKSIGVGSSATKPRPNEWRNQVVDEKPQCYELFCIHQSSLLAHRSQPIFEAELLAKRLDKLIRDATVAS